jgi:hypothetical protein
MVVRTRPYDGVAQSLIPYTVYIRSVFGPCFERQRAKRRVDGIICFEYRMMKFDKVCDCNLGGAPLRGNISPFTEWLQPGLGYLKEGRLLTAARFYDYVSFASLRFRCVMTWEDSGSILFALVHLSRALTRKEGRTIWIFEETAAGFIWTSLMMDCTWYMFGFAFRPKTFAQ